MILPVQSKWKELPQLVRVDFQWWWLITKQASTMGDLVERIFLAKAEKPAPKPVPVAKPMDSDGDGVTDDKDQCPNTPIGATVDCKGLLDVRSGGTV